MNTDPEAPRMKPLQQQSTGLQNTPSDDDDDFVDPPPRAALLEKSVNIIRNQPATAKPPMKANKYIRPPTVRCAPAIFNSFVDHLTMNQRIKIRGMGFSGLLKIAAEGLESRDLLQFLMDRLNPLNMEIDLGKERTLKITPVIVNKVLGLPIGGDDIPAPTKAQSSEALIQFRELIHVLPNQPVKSEYLQYLQQTGMFEDEMSIKLFFIIAFNKLLFPDTSNYIRGKDIFITQDISDFPDLDWSKAVVDNLRDASMSWHESRGKEGNKSISGCSILLIIFYLDNLRCHHQINHRQTPRAQFFNKSVIESIMKADRTKDKDGKVTFGKLQLRNRDELCYYTSGAKIPQAPLLAGDAPADYRFPSIQEELCMLVDQVADTASKRELSLAFSAFDSQTEDGISYINKGQFMLLDAHHKVINTIKHTLEKEIHEKTCDGDVDRPTSRRKTYHDADVECLVLDNGHAEPTRVGHELQALQQPGSMDDRPQNFNSPNQELEFLPADAHAQPARVGDELPALKQPSIMDDRPLNCNSPNQDMEFVGHANAHADPTSDKEVHELTQEHESTEDKTINSDSNKDGNSPSQDVASLVDTLITMIDSCANQKLSHNSEHFNPSQRTNTWQLESDVPFDGAQVENVENPSVLVRSGHESDEHDREGPGSNNVSIESFQAEENTDTSDDKLGPVLMRLCTQEEDLLQKTMGAPSKRITRVPAKYVSPFKGIIQRPKVSSTKAIAVRKKFCKSLKSSRDTFISVGSSVYSGSEIYESFGDDDATNILSSRFMATYVRCMRHDEETNMPDGGGYRVFLHQELLEMINMDEYDMELDWPFQDALMMLQQSLTAIAPQKVKLFFFPILHKDHWSVYCINMMHKRIDVLDSDAANNAVYHEVLGDRIIPRLNALFQQVTSGLVKNFTKWRRPVRHMAEHASENDSGFFAAKFMELWDGDSLTTPVKPDKITQIRSELLFYLLYHPLNETKKLPAGLEAFRPRI